VPSAEQDHLAYHIRCKSDLLRELLIRAACPRRARPGDAAGRAPAELLLSCAWRRRGLGSEAEPCRAATRHAGADPVQTGPKVEMMKK